MREPPEAEGPLYIRGQWVGSRGNGKEPLPLHFVLLRCRKELERPTRWSMTGCPGLSIDYGRSKRSSSASDSRGYCSKGIYHCAPAELKQVGRHPELSVLSLSEFCGLPTWSPVRRDTLRTFEKTTSKYQPQKGSTPYVEGGRSDVERYFWSSPFEWKLYTFAQL